MTRVLFLTESFHPTLGGGEQHIHALARGLAASGLPATVLTRQADPSWPAEETLEGVRVLRVRPPGPGRTGKYRMVPWALAALRREGSRHDVLVVRGTRVLGLPGLLAGRVLGLAVVLQPEVNGEMSGEVYTWGNWLDRPLPRRAVRAATFLRNMLLRDADAFVAMSRAIERELLEAGAPREKVAWLPHGVDLERFRPVGPREQQEARARLGLPAGDLLVTYTGRLLRGKGLETLLEAFARVSAAEPRARLLLVGSGAGQSLSVEEQLAQQVRNGGLGERVTFTGRVDDVAPCLRASDVFAFPSVFEALGISLIEAAASGLPCVGARTGGIVDVIEGGRSGLLFEPGDTADLARALTSLLADPARRAALGARAREVARERFDLRYSLERYRSLFFEVSARHVSSRVRDAESRMEWRDR